MAKKNATVYTVAKLAGVSIATVSRTLTGSPKVAPETRQRVIQAADALHYVPDPAARRLAHQRADTIALVFPDISGPYYSSVIRGVERAAGGHDNNVLIYGTHAKASIARFLRDLASQVDGLIIMARSIEETYLVWLQEQNVPFVLLSSPHPLAPSDTVQVDNQRGAYEAARHLLEHGYQRIAILAGPESSPDNRERLEGYGQALREADVSIPPDLVACGNFQFEGGRAALEGLLQKPSPPAAVLAANDEMALGAIAAARQHGLRVPEDVAVIGFDDIQVAGMTCPPLTTVQQPMELLGEIAVKLLIARLKNREAPCRHETLKTRLLVRQSCGCPVA